MKDTDRQTILARRAMFIASALGSMTVSQRSHASPAEEEVITTCPAPTDPQSLELARMYYKHVGDLLDQGRDAEALTEAEGAYNKSPTWPLLFLRAQLHDKASEFARALRDFRGVLLCIEAATEKPPAMARTEPLAREAVQRLETYAKVRVNTEAEHLLLDGEQVRLLGGILLAPAGAHALRLVRGDQEALMHFEVAERQELELNTPTFAPPEPCLSPLPCLQPPPPPPPLAQKQLRPKLELGLLPWVSVLGPEVREELLPIGGGARLGFEYGLSEVVGLSFALHGAALDGVGGLLGHAGGFFGFSLHFGPAWIGAGSAVGYQFGSQTLVAGQAAPVHSLFVSPELTLIGMRVSDALGISMRVHTLLAGQHGPDGDAFGLSHVGAGVWLGYRFGQGKEEPQLARLSR